MSKREEVEEETFELHLKVSPTPQQEKQQQQNNNEHDVKI